MEYCSTLEVVQLNWGSPVPLLFYCNKSVDRNTKGDQRVERETIIGSNVFKQLIRLR